MVVVVIVTPVFYLLYYEVLMKADVSHHTTMPSTNPKGMQHAQIPEPVEVNGKPNSGPQAGNIPKPNSQRHNEVDDHPGPKKEKT